MAGTEARPTIRNSGGRRLCRPFRCYVFESESVLQIAPLVSDFVKEILERTHFATFQRFSPPPD